MPVCRVSGQKKDPALMFEPVIVSLSRIECLTALEAGLRTHLHEIGERFKATRIGSITSWDVPLNEALAEVAVRKWLNGRTDVKARSALKDYGNLIISDTDAPSDIIALVSCMPPQFKIEGFVRVADAQSRDDCMRQTLAGRRWWISKDKLNDPRELGNG